MGSSKGACGFYEQGAVARQLDAGAHSFAETMSSGDAPPVRGGSVGAVGENVDAAADSCASSRRTADARLLC